MAIKKYIGELQNCIDRAKSLEKEYQGKKKSEAYSKRMAHIQNKFKSYISRINNIGHGVINQWEITTIHTIQGEIKHKVWLSEDFEQEDAALYVMYKSSSHTWVTAKVKQQIILGKPITELN